MQDAPALEIGRDVAAIVLGEPYELPAVRVAAAVDPATYERYVGRYSAEPAFDARVFTRDGRFFAHPAGGEPVELFPASATRFFLTVIAADVTFMLDSSGRVTGLVFKDHTSQGGPETTAAKVE